MNIGTVSKKTGVAAKTIRYYEEIGLLPPAERRDNGYRWYGVDSLQILRFLKHARGLGFGIDACRELLSLYEKSDRSSADVKSIAELRLSEIDAKLLELRNMRDALSHLVDQCAGGDIPDCPILENLAAE